MTTDNQFDWVEFYKELATKSSCFDTKHEDFFLHL